MKRRKDATRKDNFKVSNGLFAWHFRLYRSEISSFRVVGFVFSSSRMTLFRLSEWLFFVFSSFSMASFRLFAWHLFAAKRRKNVMAQSSHHILQQTVKVPYMLDATVIKANSYTFRGVNSSFSVFASSAQFGLTINP